MRDAVCAEVASCGRSLQLMCPDIVVWIPNNTWVSAPHAYTVQNTLVQSRSRHFMSKHCGGQMSGNRHGSTAVDAVGWRLEALVTNAKHVE